MPVPLKKDFQELIEKYLNATASDEEIRTIENYYAHFAADPEITKRLTDHDINVLKNRLRSGINARIKQLETPVVPFYRKRYFQVAAAVLFFLLSSLVFINRRQPQFVAHQTHKQDLSPGGNKATLTLSDGSTLVLNNLKDGDLSRQAGAQITKRDSLLSYKATTKNISQTAYNIITIPKGGQYQLVLADGTKVWLNAASSLKFPIAFTGNERTVELTGEAYFEVAKDATKPFNVKTATQTIRVLGTHFNVNAYADEETVKTTLLEGSVKVSSSTNQLVIKPGQQSVMNNSGAYEVINDADIDEITAWKNGMFQFNDASIQTIMRQISRWYNVDVEFKGPIPASTYHGKISRNSNASQVLKILELSGINFTIEGRKIIVK